MNWREWTIIEWSIVAAIGLIVMAVAFSSADNGQSMDACRRKCGQGSYAALVPSGQHGFMSCACYDEKPIAGMGR